MIGTNAAERMMKNVRPYVDVSDTQKYNRVYSLLMKVPVVYANETEETKGTLRYLSSNGVALKIDRKQL